MKLESVAEIVSGTPPVRIMESFERNAPLYTFYNQAELMCDLSNKKSLNNDSKQIRTLEDVCTLKEGDIVFSLLSGTASLVRKNHDGYLYTHNYAKLILKSVLDSGYLVYLLNEDETIRKQFMLGLQGSQVMKYTMKQLKETVLPSLPAIEKQKCIGNIYLKQLQLEDLKKRVAEMETVLIIQELREAGRK